MAESKSRYGIIEELAARKNQFLQDIADLEDEIDNRQLDYKRAGEDLEARIKAINRSITLTKQQIKNTDEAIQSLKDISRESKQIE